MDMLKELKDKDEKNTKLIEQLKADNDQKQAIVAEFEVFKRENQD